MNAALLHFWGITKRRGFIRDFVLTSGTNLILLVLSLATGAIVARLLGPDGRGELASIQNIANFISRVALLGLPLALPYFVGRNANIGPNLLVTAWVILVPLSIIGMAIGYISTPFLLASQDAHVIASARLFLLYIPLSAISIVSSALQVWGEFAIWNKVRILNMAMYICVLAIAWLTAKTSSSFVSQGLLLTLFVGPIIMIKVATDHGLKITTRPVWEMTKPLCVYGLKNIFGTLPQFVNTRIDQILMGMLLPAQYLGLYVVAVSWSGIGSVLTNSISTILFPRISSDTSLEQSRTRMLRVVRLTTVISLIWTIFHLLVTPFVIPLIFGSDFRAAVPAALILVLTAPIQQLDSVLSSGLRGIGKPGLVGWSQGIGVIVTTILLYFLLPTFKELGAAVASLTAYSASFLITTYMFMNHFDIKPGELFILTHKEVSYLISFIKQKP